MVSKSFDEVSKAKGHANNLESDRVTKQTIMSYMEWLKNGKNSIKMNTSKDKLNNPSGYTRENQFSRVSYQDLRSSSQNNNKKFAINKMNSDVNNKIFSSSQSKKEAIDQNVLKNNECIIFKNSGQNLNSGINNNLIVNSVTNGNPTYQDKYGNFFFPSLSRVKKKARKVREKKKIISDLSNYGSLNTQSTNDPIHVTEKIDAMGNYNTPVKRNDSQSKRAQSKKAY